jgi:hypothetical protein
MKPISEQLTDLSARAKQAEIAGMAARDQAAEKVEQREASIKAAATQRKANARQQGMEVRDNVSSAWSGIQNKVQSDVDDLRAKIDYKKYEHDRTNATKAADDAESSAMLAIDFAFDAIDYAETAVLDAALARETANSF